MSELPETIFFTDRDLGTRFPDVLAAAGLNVERHQDHFAPDCSDEHWLATIGERGWIAVTHDRRIRHKPNELAAIVRHRVALLIVIGKVPLSLLAQSFLLQRRRGSSTSLRYTGRRSSPRSIAPRRRSSIAIRRLRVR